MEAECICHSLFHVVSSIHVLMHLAEERVVMQLPRSLCLCIYCCDRLPACVHAHGFHAPLVSSSCCAIHHLLPGVQVAYPADTLRPQVTFQVRPAHYHLDRTNAAVQPQLFFGMNVVNGCCASACWPRAAATWMHMPVSCVACAECACHIRLLDGTSTSMQMPSGIRSF